MGKTCRLLSWDKIETTEASNCVPPACSFSDIACTSLIKQEATASLLINQLMSCSLRYLSVLVDPCSLFTRDAAVEHGPRPAFDRITSMHISFALVLFREILLTARLLFSS